MIKVSETKLKDVMLIEPEPFEDLRGYYLEIYSKQTYQEQGINIDFVEEDVSVSLKNVLRGIHGDNQTWKLISCLQGKFYLVVVNCDRESDNFGEWESFVLSDRNNKQVLIPPKHGNGHLVLSEQCIFHYKQSCYYDPSKQFTYKWDDPELNLWWPIKDPILSVRDTVGPLCLKVKKS